MPWKHKSSAEHNGEQPGCKWTSQIWKVAHCLGLLDRGHYASTYDISQICRNMMCFHSCIDKLWISQSSWCNSSVKKNYINFCPGVYLAFEWLWLKLVYLCSKQGIENQYNFRTICLGVLNCMLLSLVGTGIYPHASLQCHARSKAKRDKANCGYILPSAEAREGWRFYPML